MDDHISEMDDLLDEEDENVDSDGEPLPSPEEIINIINAIPSFKFEEATNDSISEASSSRKSTRKEK